MLSAVKGKDKRIKKIVRKDDRLYLYSDAGCYRLEPKNARTIRITYTKRESFCEEKKPGIVNFDVCPEWKYTVENNIIMFQTEEVLICINGKTASFQYFDGQGKLLLKEREKDSKTLEEFTVYKPLEENMQVERVNTPDGTKEVVKEAAKIPDGTLYHTRLYLEWQEQEALYGLGQNEEGISNLRGQTVYVHQANRKIAVPMLISSLGYGLLIDTYSPMIFQDTVYGSYLYTEADEEMDYYFMNGGSMDGVVSEYRKLTGKATLLPKWAYGYIQSQERYETAEEILSVAKEYRRRELGLDGIVLDWCSWEGNMWGQKTFDKTRFENPALMIEKLHKQNVHFMISIWPNMDEKTENYKEFREQGLLLPGSGIYNALSEKGRRLYWKQLEEGLFCHGVDAWWCDSSEPFTPEWNHVERVEPSRMYEEYCRTAAMHLPASKGNAYALYHAKAVYEGQRGTKEGEKKRVVNLTRSGYTGQQRYGTILWSGDIAASWDTLKRQIASGLSFCASGLPYWTVDIGAFFVKEGGLWYWKGDYEGTTQDAEYCELFVRWYQWAGFLPIFRGHGTDCHRELWQFGDTGEPFYEALVQANRLRYELMPYIYSLAGRVWLEDASMIKLLAFEFPKDSIAREISDQYLFGEELMVCPVTKPQTSGFRTVYLPGGTGWYDYWSHEFYQGGQWIEVGAPLERIPLFVREGSVIPRTVPVQSTAEMTEMLMLDVYTGRDGEFMLYEDEGDGYGYEKGKYRRVSITWEEQTKRLSITAPDKHKDRVLLAFIIQKDGTIKEEKEIYEKTSI